MKSILHFVIHFLDPVPRFHGRGGDGDPEWPPAPLRFFQALVSAAATRWRESQFQDYAQPALRWLESRQPSIATPNVSAMTYGYRMYVPNNSGDLMTAAWARGDTETSMAKFRVEKDVRPTHLAGANVHYLYPVAKDDSEATRHLEVLKAAARSITHLGWGIDMVAADAEIITDEEAAKLPGHQWRAVPSGGVPLRVPKSGTLEDLMRKHKDFLKRLPDGRGFKPVPPLQCFETVHYFSDTAPGCRAPGRPYAAFKLLMPDAEKAAVFNKLTGTRDVAAMIRHKLDLEYQRFGFSADQRAAFVNGHRIDGGPLRGEGADHRLMFLPLPTINPALGRVEAIRRLIVVGPPGEMSRIQDLNRRLAGELLEHHNHPRALLTVLPKSDWVLRQYTEESETWSTVVPAVFPGHHKGNLEKANDFARRMFEHSGLPEPVEFWWRAVGFRAGAELASRYSRPEMMNGSMYHVRVRFPRKIPGPIAIGAGRYRGFGLLARDE